MDALPSQAPSDPLPLAERWLADAVAAVAHNPWAMALATVSAAGRPSVRYVLLKTFSATDRYLGFYTNYGSRKAAELDAAGVAAAALYWPHSGRQLRFEGRIARAPDADSDAYFRTRPRLSQLNAWASAQSRPIAGPELMDEKLAAREAEFGPGSSIPRPPGWGGYRLTIDALEFWLEGSDRFHRRLRYEHESPDSWQSVWLQP
jgi:pyridoxamine 5'-phosphate oxidase